jgi:hypothetical protein
MVSVPIFYWLAFQFYNLLAKPRLRAGAMLILKCYSIILYMLYTNKPLSLSHPLESFNVFKKPHLNPMSSFKDLSIHREGQTAGTDFVLYYVLMIFWCKIKNYTTEK